MSMWISQSQSGLPQPGWNVEGSYVDANGTMIKTHTYCEPVMEERKSDSSWALWQWISVFVLFVVASVLAGVLWMNERTLESDRARRDIIVEEALVFTTHAPYRFDCDAGYAQWEQEWSIQKRHYCCDQFGRACHFPLPVTSLPFDCDAGFANWQAGWSPSKKQWCCAHMHRGCAATAFNHYHAVAASYNCHDQPVNTWSEGKRHYCCHQQSIGCATAAYDCDAGFSTWKQGWSADKKIFCCSHFHRGCEANYDCDAGLSNSEAAWSEAKKQWCCQHEHKGCPSQGCNTVCHYRNQAATCHDRIQYLATHEFAHKAEACRSAYHKVQDECSVCSVCSHEESHCTALPVISDDEYDCDADYDNWKHAWTAPKKSWCCNHKHRGCEEAHMAYDCDAALANFKDAWSEPKKQWCCAHQQKGCVEPAH